MTQANALAYTPLAHIDEVQPLSDQDQSLIWEIYEVLKNHDALERFGLSLLHRHFEVAENEILLETTDIANRTQTIRPVPRREMINEEYIETAWRLDTGGPVMYCICRRRENKHTGDHDHHR